jgi:cellulase/cellobiase CelA1
MKKHSWAVYPVPGRYIQKIYDIVSKPAYKSLRFAAMVEPDSLPNMITNLKLPSCKAVYDQEIYVKVPKLNIQINLLIEFVYCW